MKESARTMLKTSIKSIAISICMMAVVLFLAKGINAGGFVKAENIEWAEFKYNNEIVEINDKEEIKKALDMVNCLSIRFPDSAYDEVEAEYILHLKNGKTLTVGAGSTSIFRNGKTYKGDENQINLFKTYSAVLFLN